MVIQQMLSVKCVYNGLLRLSFEIGGTVEKFIVHVQPEIIIITTFLLKHFSSTVSEIKKINVFFNFN